MVRSQIVALSVGAGIAVVGLLAWQGLLPGVPPLKPRTVSQAQLPAKSSTAEPKVAATPAAPKEVPANNAAAPEMPAVATAKPTQGVPPQTVAPPVAPQPVIPQFDTVRVEPSGESVIAGHGTPGAQIDLMAGDKIIGQVQADHASGDFVIVPKTLVPGNYELALRSRSGAQAAVRSRQTIAVSVPAKGQKGLMVALTEPGKATVLLADPTAKEAAKPAAADKKATGNGEAAVMPSVAFKTAESDKGAFYTTGVAPSGTHLRIYLNGSRMADVVADADGHWSMTISKGMVPGRYTVRADAIDAAGKVIARAEVPFDMPTNTMEAKLQGKAGPAGQDVSPSSNGVEPKPAAEKSAPSEARIAASTANVPVAAPAPVKASASSAVVPEIGTASVHRGDSLWRISRKVLGSGIRYTLIYAANSSQIRDPNLIYPGQVFVVPRVNH